MLVWKLDRLMRERQIKGRELAKRMGIGENYLSRVRHEAPDRISLALLDGLCEGLGCSVADLLEFQPGPAPASTPPEAPSRQPAARIVRRQTPSAAPEKRSLAPVAEAPAPPREASKPWVPAAWLEPLPAVARSIPPAEPEAPSDGRPAVRDLFARLVQANVEPAPAGLAPAVLAPDPVPPSAGPVGSTYLKGGSLQAKLDRLKRRRPD